MAVRWGTRPDQETLRGTLATLPWNSAAIGVNRRGANYFVYDPFDGQNAIMNYQNDPITRAGLTAMQAMGVPLSSWGTLSNHTAKPITEFLA